MTLAFGWSVRDTDALLASDVLPYTRLALLRLKRGL